MSSPETENFSHHYQTLQTIANKLQNQKDIDIDSLLADSRTAITAYNFCKNRIDSATKELDKLFSEIEESSAER